MEDPKSQDQTSTPSEQQEQQGSYQSSNIGPIRNVRSTNRNALDISLNGTQSQLTSPTLDISSTIAAASGHPGASRLRQVQQPSPRPSSENTNPSIVDTNIPPVSSSSFIAALPATVDNAVSIPDIIAASHTELLLRVDRLEQNLKSFQEDMVRMIRNEIRAAFASIVERAESQESPQQRSQEQNATSVDVMFPNGNPNSAHRENNNGTNDDPTSNISHAGMTSSTPMREPSLASFFLSTPQISSLRHSNMVAGSSLDTFLQSSPAETASKRSNTTPLQEDMYKMSRSIRTVREAWQEYTQGLDGGPAVRDLDQQFSSRWRRSPNERKQYSRRKPLYDALEWMTRDRIPVLSDDEAVSRIQQLADNNRWTLSRVCDHLARLRPPDGAGFQHL